MTHSDYVKGYLGDLGYRNDATDKDDFDRGVENFRRDKEHSKNKNGAQREKLLVQPYDLVPFQEITEAYVRVAEYGAVKYDPWNWSNGLSRVQILGSLLRHVFAYIRGKDNDKESGLSHTDHILWNAVALVHNVYHGLEDDRRKEPRRSYSSGDAT